MRSIFIVACVGVIGLLGAIITLKQQAGSSSNGSRQLLLQEQEQQDTTTDCLTPELHGEWVTVDGDVPPGNSTCCGMRWGHFLENTAQCGLQNHQRYAHGDFGANIQDGIGYAPQFDVPACQLCEKRNFQEHYRWDAAALPAFDAKAFCQTDKNRKLLLVGDSTMSQAAGVLLNAVRGANCSASQIRFAMSDTLVGEAVGRLNRGRKWRDIVDEHKPDVVVISTGAHIFGEDNFDRIFLSVLDGIDDIRKENPNIQFIWKTQSPGGPCNQQENNDSDETEQIQKGHPFQVARHLDWTGHTFQHDTFFDRDRRVIATLQERQIPFLDMRMLYSRTDAHLLGVGKDCLHYCVEPGPLEVFPRLLQKVIFAPPKFLVSPCAGRRDADGRVVVVPKNV